jgi:hypothetical protein
MVRRLMLCVIGVTVLSACGDDTTTRPASAPSPVATAAAPAASNTGAIPDSLAFSAPRVGGGSVNLADYAGKPVMLWFWAPT